MELIIHQSEEHYGRVISFMEINGHAYARSYTFNDDVKTFFLDSLSVSKEYRNRGYGTELQQIREKIAKDSGYKYTMLWVVKKTWMIKWYKSRGYKYYKPYKEENAIWLRKKI